MVGTEGDLLAAQRRLRFDEFRNPNDLVPRIGKISLPFETGKDIGQRSLAAVA